MGKPDKTKNLRIDATLARELTAEEQATIGKIHEEAISRRIPRAMRIEREGAEALTVALYPDRSYTFGRAAECSFFFPSDTVSRNHGELRFRYDNRWVYRDLNSRNGTFKVEKGAPEDRDPRLGSKPLRSSELEIESGDTLLLGNAKSRVTFLEEVPAGLVERGSTFQSKASHALERSIEIAGRHALPVLLLGPSGAGKTHTARLIHEKSRSRGNFVVINCGRLPTDPAQLTSELLGHAKGSFTGAIGERVGRLRSADGGTLFLDEVESLNPAAQDFLLDVIEGRGNFAPYGAPFDSSLSPPRFRLIAASKAPLSKSGLRQDLCFRLAAGDSLILPTLEERAEDIPRLASLFLDRLQAEQQIDAKLTDDAMRLLQRTRWPGHVRELETAVKVVVTREHAAQELDGIAPKRLVIGIRHVESYLRERTRVFDAGPAVRSAPTAEFAVPARKRPADLTAAEIQAALDKHGGNKTHAAAELGIALNTLKAKLKAPAS